MTSQRQRHKIFLKYHLRTRDLSALWISWHGDVSSNAMKSTLEPAGHRSGQPGPAGPRESLYYCYGCWTGCLLPSKSRPQALPTSLTPSASLSHRGNNHLPKYVHTGLGAQAWVTYTIPLWRERGGGYTGRSDSPSAACLQGAARIMTSMGAPHPPSLNSTDPYFRSHASPFVLPPVLPITKPVWKIRYMPRET